MKNEDVYIFNPDYDLKVDKNRIFIFNKVSDPLYEDFIGFVHPVYAILISLFDGKRSLSEVNALAASLLKMAPSDISNIISPLLENEKDQFFKYEGYHFSFPVKLLMKKNNHEKIKFFDPKSFLISKTQLDMESLRFHSPLDAILMINTRCVTDCIYCYADRRKTMDCDIPLERLEEIICEAADLGMRSFDFTGGELFLYKYWEELLTVLLSNGFKPYISTKVPIDLEIVDKLKCLGVDKIQISIDTVVKDEMVQMLGVSQHYYEKLMETLKILDEKGFSIFTNSQITSINQDSIDKLLQYLLSLKNIRSVKLGVAGFSLYKGETEYLNYRPQLDKVKKADQLIKSLKNRYGDTVSINMGGYASFDDLINKSDEEKRKNFYNRARCSGNFYGFVVLPDGKVTICEELYWHPKFIIGDLKKQSIKEVWNSPRARELYELSPNAIRNESECKTCHEFNDCHKYKGVCWKDVLFAYGEENWDYPDPKCHRARKPFREFYL